MLCKKSLKMTSNSKLNVEKTESTEKQKTSFLKDQVESAYLYKFVLKKTIAVHE